MISYSYFILFLGYLIASYTDTKSRIIPIWLFPSVLVVSILEHRMNFSSMAGFFIMFIASMCSCLRGDMAGGDLLMFSVTGWVLGIRGLIPFTIILSTIGLILQFFSQEIHREKKLIPLAPLGLIAYTIFLCLCIGGKYAY